MIDVVAVLAAYVLGAIPFAQIVALRRYGVDLRTVGTGTVSGTGLYRVEGFRPLVLGGSLDVAKGAVAVTFAAGDARLEALAAAAVVTGHCWSLFLRGAGGRGVSPALGALAVLAWPGAVVLLAGLAFGRLARQTGLGVFVADLLVVVLLAATRGSAGAALGLAVVAPMLLKRLLGNSAPEPGAGLRTYRWRLLFDADPPSAVRPEIDSGTLEAIVRLLAARLAEHRDELNRLNVYPVPDGDTGDNLAATLGTVVEHLPDGGDWARLTAAVARGAMLGGRGSSGVILGQALRGFVQTLPDHSGADGLACALGVSATAARASVADPVDGTILSVAADAARVARAVSVSSGSLAEVVRGAAAEGRRSLARTPDLLPALARAGVVDAGGLGYVLFLDVLAEVVAGVESPPIEVTAPRTAAQDEGPVTEEAAKRYEVMCLLDTEDDRIDSLRQRWLSLGDTVAIAGGERTWRAHVHTHDVLAALEAAREVGEVSEVEVTDLAGHAAEERGLRGASMDGAVSIVAVAEGDGLVARYLEAGAHRVVIGGGTSKPSTGELLRAVDACRSPVVLLAGDKDVVPAARLAVEQSRVPAHLVRADMLAGLIAVEEVGPGLVGDAAAGAARLDEVSRSIRSLRILRAVRDIRTELGDVRSGDWLAMGDAGPVAIATTPATALLNAVAATVTPASTSGLLAVDREASPDVDVVTRLRQAHPHVGWRVLRSNRPGCAYGVAVR